MHHAHNIGGISDGVSGGTPGSRNILLELHRVVRRYDVVCAVRLGMRQ